MPPSLSPQQFVATWRLAIWRAAALKESAAYQAPFIDVCRLVGHDAPAEVDPQGRFFVFQAAGRS